LPEELNRLTTPVDEIFGWRPSPAGRILVSRHLFAVAPHLFSTRQLEFRAETQDRDYARVGECFQVSAEQVLRVRQVHGRVVVTVRPGEHWSAIPEADAIVSLDPARAISVRVADCVPLLVADRAHRAVAAIHAGWRGTASRVTEAVVDVLAGLGVPPDDLVVAIGPSIGPCCYQVDRVVRRAFDSSDADSWFTDDGAGHWRLDLSRANREQLVARGVPSEQIGSCDFCTLHDREHWPSFRRDGTVAGRMVAAIRVTTNG
jgi:YfiH family protein